MRFSPFLLLFQNRDLSLFPSHGLSLAITFTEVNILPAADSERLPKSELGLPCAIMPAMPSPLRRTGVTGFPVFGRSVGRC
jgi:hypothetical protein